MDYINCLAEWVSGFTEARLTLDDSDARITADEVVIKVRISGLKSFEAKVRPPTAKEKKRDLG